MQMILALDLLILALKLVTKAANKDDTRLGQHGVQIRFADDRVSFFATNGHILATVSFPAQATEPTGWMFLPYGQFKPLTAFLGQLKDTAVFDTETREVFGTCGSRMVLGLPGVIEGEVPNPKLLLFKHRGPVNRISIAAPYLKTLAEWSALLKHALVLEFEGDELAPVHAHHNGGSFDFTAVVMPVRPPAPKAEAKEAAEPKDSLRREDVNA